MYLKVIRIIIEKWKSNQDTPVCSKRQSLPISLRVKARAPPALFHLVAFLPMSFFSYSDPATPAFFKLLMAGNFTSEALKVLPWRNSLHADICRIRYLTCFKSLLKSCLYNEAFRPSCLIIKHISYSFWFLSVFHHFRSFSTITLLNN